MSLSSSRIRVVFFIIALFPCLSCTADAITDKHESESVCVAIEQLLDSLDIFINDKMSVLLAQSTDEIADEVTPELLGDLTQLISCSNNLTALELRNKTTINRERCDPFPISVSLSGLKESLKEVAECRVLECNPDKITLKREVIQLQTNRLEILSEKCRES